MLMVTFEEIKDVSQTQVNTVFIVHVHSRESMTPTKHETIITIQS